MEMTLEMKNAVNRRRDMLERGVITSEEYDKFVDAITKVDEPTQANIRTSSGGLNFFDIIGLAFFGALFGW